LRSETGRVMVSVVAPVLACALAAASLVIGLAAVVRMAGPPAAGEPIEGIIALPDPLVAAILGLFAMAGLVFLASAWRRGLFRRRPEDGPAGLSREPSRMPAWMRALAQLASLVNVLVLAYALWRGTNSLGLFQLGPGAGSGIGAALHRTITASAPPLVAWTFGILALGAALGALGLALWVALADRPGSGDRGDAASPPAPLEIAVEEGLDDLRSEPDARRAIIRCYARFERAAASSGVERRPWLTPMEFMREVLMRLPAPQAAVPGLTRLFELARFSDHALGTAERDRALEALDDIRTAIAARDADAATR